MAAEVSAIAPDLATGPLGAVRHLLIVRRVRKQRTVRHDLPAHGCDPVPFAGRQNLALLREFLHHVEKSLAIGRGRTEIQFQQLQAKIVPFRVPLDRLPQYIG